MNKFSSIFIFIITKINCVYFSIKGKYGDSLVEISYFNLSKKCSNSQTNNNILFEFYEGENKKDQYLKTDEGWGIENFNSFNIRVNKTVKIKIFDYDCSILDNVNIQLNEYLIYEYDSSTFLRSCNCNSDNFINKTNRFSLQKYSNLWKGIKYLHANCNSYNPNTIYTIEFDIPIQLKELQKHNYVSIKQVYELYKKVLKLNRNLYLNEFNFKDNFNLENTSAGKNEGEYPLISNLYLTKKQKVLFMIIISKK